MPLDAPPPSPDRSPPDIAALVSAGARTDTAEEGCGEPDETMDARNSPDDLTSAQPAPVTCSWCSTPSNYCRGLCRRCYRKALTVECDGVTLPPTARMGRPPSHGHHLIDLVMMAGPDMRRLVMDALRADALTTG